MVGIGFAWASILSLPYALLADSVPSRKMGLYMGIFNFFIVIPQLVAASVLGAVLKPSWGAADLCAGGRWRVLSYRRPAGASCAAPHEPRTTSLVGSTMPSACSLRSMRSSVSTSTSPARCVSCMTVVNGGCARLAAGISSNPTIDTCPGTSMPRLCSARIAPIAIRSLAATIASKSRGAQQCRWPRRNPTVPVLMASTCDGSGRLDARRADRIGIAAIAFAELRVDDSRHATEEGERAASAPSRWLRVS